MTQVTELRGSVLGKGYRLGQSVGDVRDHLYEARHDRIPGRFLIRLFPAESLLRPEAAARIQRAARVASLLRDVHVVQVLDFSVSGELPAFVVMQRTDADPLWLAMAQVGTLPLARGVEIVEAVAAALASSHRLGLIHGDLRPELVLLPSSGAPAAQVAGFGWGKEFRVASAVPQSPAYLAPEQLPGSTTPIDERVDQFALGAIAYELLGGKLPFAVESSDRADLRAGAPLPPPLAGAIAGISSEIDEILRTALATRPEQRFASVRTLAVELKRAAAQPARVMAPGSASDVSLAGATTMAAGSTAEGASAQLPEVGAGSAGAAGGERAPSSAEIPSATDAGAEIELDGADEDLALAVAPAVAIAVALDEGKTQVTRSPFFEAGDVHDDALGEGEEAEAEIDVDDIRYDDGQGRGSGRAGLPIARPHAYSRSHSHARSPSGRASRPAVRSWPAAHAHTGSYPGANRDGRWETGDTEAESQLEAQAESIDPDPYAEEGAAVSETTQPDGKPFPRAARRSAAWLLQVQKQPSWVVGTVAGGVFLVGLTVLLARGRATQATGMVGGPLAMRGDQDRQLEPRAASAAIRIEPILMPSALPAPPPDCLLSLTDYAGAEIWIDERDTGKKAPVDALVLACGTHELSLRRPDGSVAVLESVELSPGQAPVRH